MSYDFTTLRDGYAQGSYKWQAMKEQMPDVPSGIVPLSVADMEFPLPKEIREGIARALETTFIGYNAATDAYYEAIIQWMEQQHNWQVDKESILPYQGVVPALEQAVRAFTKEGDGVLIFTPVYPPFRGVVEKTRRRVLASPLREEGGEYTIDFEDAREKAKAAKLMILCSPHNPVGRVWEEAELKELAQIAKEEDLVVISDEIHHDLALTREHIVFNRVDPDVKTVVATAPTKTFNLAGAKVSNLIIRDEKIRRQFLEEGELPPSVLGMIAGEQAYRQGASWLQALKEQIRENEQAFRSILKQRAPIVRFSPLEGTYLLWVDLRAMAQASEERERFVTETHVFPHFGEKFGEEGTGFIRLNLAAPKAVIEGAAHRLADAIERRACCW